MAKRSNSFRGCCHALGIIFMTLTVACVIVGLALMFAYQRGQPVWYLGIALLALAAASGILSMIYTCVALSREWNLFGVVKMKLRSGMRYSEAATGNHASYANDIHVSNHMKSQSNHGSGNAPTVYSEIDKPHLHGNNNNNGGADWNRDGED